MSVKLVAAVCLLALTSALEQGQIIGGDAVAPACVQNGVKASFYDALYLSQQYPFIHGEGALLDTLTPTETTVVPQINFAPPDLPKIDRLSEPLSSWPHAPPASNNGTVAVFEASLDVNFSGFWTFFVATSSPVELALSQNGNGLEAIKSSAELEVDDQKNIVGTVYLIQYNLPVGTYDLRLEWQHMLPYDVISKELLVLEWAWIADEDVVPSPSPPQFPRAIIPSSAFQTACTGDGTGYPIYSPPLDPPSEDSYPDAPPDAASPAAAPSVDTPTPEDPAAPTSSDPEAAAPAPEDSAAPSPVEPEPSSPSSGGDGTGCKVTYETMGPWPQGSGFEKVINLSLTSLGADVGVPYDIVVSGSKFENIEQAYNWEVGTPAGGGSFPGKVTVPWGTLTADRPVVLGALFQSESEDFPLDSVSVNGVTCTLTAQG